CGAVRSLAACIFMAASCRSPTFRGSEMSGLANSFAPTTAEEVRSAVEWALSHEAPLEIVGHGSKRSIGRPVQAGHTLDLSGLTGVTLYEPEELVLSARAGTPVTEI